MSDTSSELFRRASDLELPDGLMRDFTQGFREFKTVYRDILRPGRILPHPARSTTSAGRPAIRYSRGFLSRIIDGIYNGDNGGCSGRWVLSGVNTTWCYTRFGQYTSSETTAIDYLASPGLLFSRLNRVTISLVAVYRVNISCKELLADIGLHFDE